MESFFRIPLKRANLHGMLKAAISKIKANFTAYGAPRINIEDFNIVKEGKAEILFPKKETVFYNPIQQFNRDLSVTCIKAWDNLYGEECGQKRNNKKVRRKGARKLTMILPSVKKWETGHQKKPLVILIETNLI